MSKQGKKSEQVLLMPGAGGWEIWKGSGELTLVKATGEREPLEVEGIPSGDLTMAFPVRDVAAAPFVAATGDAGMYPDLAALHLERNGLRSEEDLGGILTDCFTLKREAEEAVLLPIMLSPPGEGGLPKKSPKGFDVSARCLPLPPRSVVFWREFGRWVFSVSDVQGQLVFFQALPGAMLNQQITREVGLALTQLSIQGVLSEMPADCHVWSEEGEIPPSPEAIEEIGRILGLQAHLTSKPTPRLPEKGSQLLPADIRAERVAKQKATQIRLAAAVAVIAYLGLVGFMGWKFMQEKKKLEMVQTELANTSPDALAAQEFRQKWDELKPLVENDYWPLELFFQAYQAAPKEGLKILRAEMRNQLQPMEGQQQLQRGIVMQGESEEAAQALQFDENLKKSSFFQPFEWNNPSPTEKKNDTWGFVYTGTPMEGGF